MLQNEINRSLVLYFKADRDLISPLTRKNDLFEAPAN